MLGSGQYTLTSQPELDDESSKICVLVKLTDSSVRAIDEFLKSKNNGAKKPTITFQKDKGEIVLPIDSSASRSQPAASSATESAHQLKKFLFTLSSIKESYKDTSASSECICFNDSKFKTVAPIEQKLNVLANDEVFLATKEKVNSGVEEEKKNSTKEIKPSGLIGNRNGPKATLAQPNINRIKHPTVMPPNSNIKTTPDSVNKPRNPVLDRPIRERLVHMLAVRPFTRAEILLRLFKDTPNLANERDRETVDQVLQSVAILNAKTGAYELKYETMLNEVNDEWQFYSQTEKSYVKRTINKIKQGPPPSTQPTTSSQEPAAPLKATGSSSIGVGGQKSTASAFMSLKHQSQTTNNNNNKSNLASQFESAVESLDTSNSSVSGRPSWSSNNKISPTSKQQQQQKISARPSAASAAAADQSIADLSISSSSNDSLSLSFNTSLPSLSLSMSSSKTRPAEKENHNHSSHPNDGDLSNSTPNPNKKAKFSSSTTSSSAAASYHHSNSSNRQSEIEALELNECAKRYKKIQNDQQREQYLNDFNKYHDQYTELYSYLENLSKRFTTYQQEMSQKDENSDEYQEMKRRVQREYLALQANKEYIQKRERYWLLHVRLKHIEDQIRDWTMNDSANLSE